MTKTDFRTQRTTRRIGQALIDLLQEMPFEKITVAKLCAAAKVSRSTFYAHFYDKYAIAEQLVANYQQQFSQQLATRFEPGNVHEVRAMIAPLFKWLTAEGKTTKTLLNLHLPQADLVAVIREELTVHFTQFLSKIYDAAATSVPLSYLVTQYVSRVMTELIYQLDHGENDAILAFSERAQEGLFNLAHIEVDD